MADKEIDDRLRSYDSWVASRNLSNEASDESVQALVDAVVARYDIPQRWYALKAQLLGVDRIADYDRMASIAEVDAEFTWSEATNLVLDSYGSFSSELADGVRRFIDEGWIDAPVRSARTRFPVSTPTCCSTGPVVDVTYSPWPTSSATACTRISPASRVCSISRRRSRSRRRHRCSARRSPSDGC